MILLSNREIREVKGISELNKQRMFDFNSKKNFVTLYVCDIEL